MDLGKIKELINLMDEHGLVEIEIEREGLKIRIKKALLEPGHADLVSQKVSSSQTPTPGQTIVSPPKLVEIKSPMIGIFYRASRPDAPPFVNVGDIVEPGKVICIIEAMKLMNEIKSEIKGKIIEILVSNGDPVEFGQPLFMLEPL